MPGLLEDSVKMVFDFLLEKETIAVLPGAHLLLALPSVLLPLFFGIYTNGGGLLWYDEEPLLLLQGIY